MFPTPSVKNRMAIGTLIYPHIFCNTQFGVAIPTEDSFLLKIHMLPSVYFVSFAGFVALKARIILITTFKLDSNNIHLRMVMFTSGMFVYRKAIYFYAFLRGGIHFFDFDG